MSKNILYILQELKDLPYRKAFLIFILAITGIVMFLTPDIINALTPIFVEVSE